MKYTEKGLHTYVLFVNILVAWFRPCTDSTVLATRVRGTRMCRGILGDADKIDHIRGLYDLIYIKWKRLYHRSRNLKHRFCIYEVKI